MRSITFILPAFSSHAIGGYKMVYLYANHLAAHNFRVNIVHMRSRSLLQSNRPKRWVISSSYWIGARMRPRWFKLDPRVRVMNIPEPRPDRVPDSDILVATAVSTAPVVASVVATRKTRGIYLVQGFENFAASAQEVFESWRLPLEVVVVSQWLADLTREAGVDSVLIENGIDSSIFRSSEDHSFPTVDVIAMVSNQQSKRSDLVVKVLNDMSDQRPGFTARTFGTIARPESLHPGIEHHQSPHQGVLADLYRSSRIYISTSDFEGFGLPALEAMACGAALVSTKNGGVPAFAGNAGLYADRGDAVAIRRSVEELLDDGALLQRMRSRCLERSADLTLDKALRKFFELACSKPAR